MIFIPELLITIVFLGGIGYAVYYVLNKETIKSKNFKRSDLYLIKTAKEAFKEGSFEKAIDLFLKVLEEDPTNYQILNNIGVVYLKKEKYKKAKKYFQKSIAVNPDRKANRKAYDNIYKATALIKSQENN